jgi:hypothetical protein
MKCIKMTIKNVLLDRNVFGLSAVGHAISLPHMLIRSSVVSIAQDIIQ